MSLQQYRFICVELAAYDSPVVSLECHKGKFGPYGFRHHCHVTNASLMRLW